MRILGRYEDFTEYQVEASAKDKLFDKFCKGIDKYMRAWRQLDRDIIDLLQDTLTDADWVNVKCLIKILRPFVQATKYIKGDANTPNIKGFYSAL